MSFATGYHHPDLYIVFSMVNGQLRHLLWIECPVLNTLLGILRNMARVLRQALRLFSHSIL